MLRVGYDAPSAEDHDRLAPGGTDDLSGLTLQSFDMRRIKVVIIGNLGVEPP
jgi:hypothetical protein